MAFDDHSNFGFSLVAVAPSPATSGTTLEVDPGTGTRYPATPFNATTAPDGVLPLHDNSEIVRVTDITGDVLTIVRAQEGTVAKSIAVGWRIADTATDKTFTDIETAITDITPGSIYYVHNQISASATWSISHNLDKYPGVTVVDSAGTVVEGSIQYTNSNTIVITFSAAFSGKAYLT